MPDAPRRTCVGCRRTAPWSTLVRLRRGPQGLEVGRGPGRGAWLCAADPVACLDRAVQRSALSRALRAPVDGAELGRARATLERAHGRAGSGTGPGEGRAGRATAEHEDAQNRQK